MPLTFPAHQAVVLPIKLKWPDRTDATALCVGAAAPDLAYPIIGLDGHFPGGMLLVVMPLTYVICRVLRWRAASSIAANLPDAGPFRLHSYRVLGTRRPSTVMTLTCAGLGVLSHVLLDAFTHTDRWGARLLGIDRSLFEVPLRGDVSGARVLQYAGHTLGSLIALALFAYIGRHRLLERWYGTAAVVGARSFTLTSRTRVAFWGIAAVVGGLVAAAFAASGASPVFAAILGGVAGLLVSGSRRLDVSTPPIIGDTDGDL